MHGEHRLHGKDNIPGETRTAEENLTLQTFSVRPETVDLEKRCLVQDL